MDRYHRQSLLPQIGVAGQARLAAAQVMVIGCGALGTVLAEQLVRAGVGHLRIADRDIVELTNLQRQTLFDEDDVREQMPKAVAAARRLARINSSVVIQPHVADVHAGNIEALAGLTEAGGRASLLLDGTDNAETRYLLNDVSVKYGLPWIYGACVGMTGRMMAFQPPHTPCLRCLFPTPPGPGELPTCDTAGVFSPVAAIVASLQASAAIKLIVGDVAAQNQDLFTIDLWENRLRGIDTRGSRRADCLACGQRQFEFLEKRGRAGASTATLCGRNAVQVRPAGGVCIDLGELAKKLSSAGAVEQTPHLVRCELHSPHPLRLTAFPDGRLIVQGTADSDRARSLYARYIGM